MKVHYECEFEIAHPAMSPEYVRGIVDSAIRSAQIAKPPAGVISKIEAIIV